MKQEIIDNLQAKADKKRQENLPANLKFLMDYPKETITTLRSQKLRISSVSSIIIFGILSFESDYSLFIASIFLGFCYLYGRNILYKHADLLPVIETLNFTSKREKKTLLKKHHIIVSVNNYMKAMNECLVLSIAFLGITLIKTIN